MTHEGCIGIPVTGSSKMVKAHYKVRTYEVPTPYGINEGKITDLQIRIEDRITAEYAEGEWWIEPEENDLATQLAYCILLQNHN